jgi:hypothetical protein
MVQDENRITKKAGSKEASAEDTENIASQDSAGPHCQDNQRFLNRKHGRILNPTDWPQYSLALNSLDFSI